MEGKARQSKVSGLPCRREMKKMKKLYSVILMVVLSMALCACGQKEDTQKENDKTSFTEEELAAGEKEGEEDNTDEVQEETDETADTEKSNFKINKAKKEVQNDKYEKKETLAIIHVKDFGDITVKFFPEAAPKAVENFLTHAEEGYYDGVTFHRVIDEFMIQGGDPEGTGMGGESIWGSEFEDEFSDNLAPIRGALCMANAGPGTNGSQFFIVQASETYADMFDEYFADYTISDQQKELLMEYGGTPWLSNQHTVFGQVVEGMDVVDAIAKLDNAEDKKTDENNKPLDDVVMESIEIVNPAE